MALEAAGNVTKCHVEATVNAADDIAAGDVYLTVIGSSAEAGDDGEVGRGNRTNGLITPYRPMTMEAAAGKNPVSHVGKLYNVLADRIAGGLVGDVPGIRGASCLLVSQIGRPIDQPQIVDVELDLANGVGPTMFGCRPSERLLPNLGGCVRCATSCCDRTSLCTEVTTGPSRTHAAGAG